MRLLPYLLVPLLTACASTEEKVAHDEAQIRMVAVQREAQKQEKEAQAEAQKALYAALAEVAKADPSQSGVVAMALAFQGMQGGNNDQPNTPIVTLQARQDRALQWAQALSPVAGGLITTLGVSAINASVQKDQIAANRDIQTNSQNQHAAVVGAVAELGREALVNAGDNYAGDFYTLSDDAFVDQSVTTTTTTTNTTTTTSVADSYNSADTNIDQGEDGFFVGGDYAIDSQDDFSETNNALTNNVTSSTTVTYGGTSMSLGELVNYLASLGTPYSLTVGGEVVASSTSGTGTTTTVDCSIPQFSPQHPDCV